MPSHATISVVVIAATLDASTLSVSYNSPLFFGAMISLSDPVGANVVLSPSLRTLGCLASEFKCKDG